MPKQKHFKTICLLIILFRHHRRRASLHSSPAHERVGASFRGPFVDNSLTTTWQEGFQRWRYWLGSDLVYIGRQPGSRRVLFCRLRRAVESYQHCRSQMKHSTLFGASFKASSFNAIVDSRCRTCCVTPTRSSHVFLQLSDEG